MRDGRTWLGRVAVHFESVASLRNAFTTLHGSGIEVDGHCHILELESDFVELDATSVQNLAQATTAAPAPS